ncbi:hypothetical protein BH11GEM2_BH11GEM2_06680 [soil metagenome]
MQAPIAAIVELAHLAMTYPNAARTEGLPVVARRHGAKSTGVVELADMCADYIKSGGEPAARVDDLTEHRILQFADALGFGLEEGQAMAADKFARYLRQCGVDAAIALNVLRTWNAGNRPPLSDDMLTAAYAERPGQQHRRTS